MPVVPGRATSAELRERRARDDGSAIPLLVKAAAGGGGSGMRVVDATGELAEALARRAARGAGGFGDDRCSSSATSSAPRHVEVQVLGDAHGNVVHLGERECSLQRRHQKVVEEAPVARRVDAELRERMGAAAVALARAAGYVNAGTVEFLARPTTGELLLPRDEHAAPGRAPGDRAGDRARPGASSSCGSPPASRSPFAQEDVGIARPRDRGRIYAEDPAAASSPPPAASSRLPRARAACASTAASSAGHRSAPTTTRCSRR